MPTADGYEIHLRAASIRDLKGTVPRPIEPISIEPISIDEMNEVIAAAATADTQ